MKRYYFNFYSPIDKTTEYILAKAAQKGVQVRASCGKLLLRIIPATSMSADPENNSKQTFLVLDFRAIENGCTVIGHFDFSPLVYRTYYLTGAVLFALFYIFAMKSIPDPVVVLLIAAFCVFSRKFLRAIGMACSKRPNALILEFMNELASQNDSRTSDPPD